jgi:hypothetical protein
MVRLCNATKPLAAKESMITKRSNDTFPYWEVLKVFPEPSNTNTEVLKLQMDGVQKFVYKLFVQIKTFPYTHCYKHKLYSHTSLK